MYLIEIQDNPLTVQTNKSEVQINSIICLKSTFQCMGVTVYIMRVISVDKQDDYVVGWLRCCDSKELVFFYTEARAPP